MTYLVAKPYSPRGSGRGECINNGRQALPSLVRPRFLPGDQKGPDPRVYRVVERSAFFCFRGTGFSLWTHEKDSITTEE
jgi:hypothetical protein